MREGAALHFVDGKNGVKDFDVWSFYSDKKGVPQFPFHRRARADFGESKFGKCPGESLKGRRVDIFGRSIKSVRAVCGELLISPESAIRHTHADSAPVADPYTR